MTRDLSRYKSRQKGYRNRYDTMRELGYEFTVDATSTRRRLEALQAIGWSLTEIGKMVGKNQQNMSKLATGNGRVYMRTRDAIAAVYDELSMRPNTTRYSARTRELAKARGYAAPLAWDDIDNDTEPKGMRK